MPDASIAPNVHEALDVHGRLGPQSTFDLEVPFDLPAETVYVVVVQVLGAPASIDLARRDDLSRPRVADPVDVRERDFDPLAARKIDPCDACHISRPLPLTLFMLGIPRANNPYDAIAPDDFAVLTDWFYAASDLHMDSPGPSIAELSSLTSIR